MNENKFSFIGQGRDDDRLFSSDHRPIAMPNFSWNHDSFLEDLEMRILEEGIDFQDLPVFRVVHGGLRSMLLKLLQHFFVKVHQSRSGGRERDQGQGPQRDPARNAR